MFHCSFLTFFCNNKAVVFFFLNNFLSSIFSEDSQVNPCVRYGDVTVMKYVDFFKLQQFDSNF